MQMFFDVEVFAAFVARARADGITVPIIPGIMCIQVRSWFTSQHSKSIYKNEGGKCYILSILCTQAYAGFNRMVNFCRSRVPRTVRERMEAVKFDDEAVKAYGVEFGAATCRRLIELGTPVLHFYTLNMTKVGVKCGGHFFCLFSSLKRLNKF